MALLQILDGPIDPHLIFVAGPRAAWRWIRRLSRPTAAELAISQMPEWQ